MIITWWSACGGEGKTTFAVSQAYQIARVTGQKVALLDFKEVVPDCFWSTDVSYCDVLPIYNLIEKGKLDEKNLEKNMAEHKKLPNLKIFTGVQLDRFEIFNIKHFTAVVDALKSYPYVIIDTNAGIYFSGVFAALKRAEKINVVAEPTYKSIYNTVQMVEFVVKQWGISREQINIFVNKFSPYGLEKSVVIKSFQNLKIKCFFEFQIEVIENLNKGIPAEKGFEYLLEDVGIKLEPPKAKVKLFNFWGKGGHTSADQSL